MGRSPYSTFLFHVALAVSIVVAPAVASAENRASAAPTKAPLAIDVELHSEGLLVGQLVSANGSPAKESKVTVILPDGREAVAKTNAEGGFAFRGIRGAATIKSDKALAMVRVWAPGSAPPSATPALLLVEENGVARGQYYPGNGVQNAFTKSKMLMANPLFVAGLVGTAVAIPVALANDDDDPAS